MLLLLLACTADPPRTIPSPRDLSELGLDMPAGTLVWRGLATLDRATITLPPPVTSPPPPPSFALVGKWKQEPESFGRLKVFSHPLPFHNEMPRPNYPPLGARMLRAGGEIPFVNDPSDLNGAGWFVESTTIKLMTMESPDRWREPARLDVPELATELASRTWRNVGTPADFVAMEATVGGITRPSIQLPPGAAVTWTVDVPADATLEFGVAALAPLLVEEASGTATVVWEIGGKERGSKTASAGAVPSDVRESLTAGTTTLTFRAAASGSTNVMVTAPVIHTRAGRAPRHIVMVGIDTLRQDALGIYGRERPTSPALDAWANQSVLFTHAWAPAPRTRPSFRTALTGRYPLAAADAPTLAEAMASAGFRTSGFAANVHLVPRFGFNDGFEHWHYENGARADVELSRAKEWINEHALEDTFTFVHLMDPHTYYNAPEPYGSRFHTSERPKGVPRDYDRWHIYQAMERPGWGDAQKEWVRADYDGEVAFMTDQLAAFFLDLEDLPGQTLTVVHSDHGEEFWDHGAFEHNHTLYDELVRAVLWIRPPGGVTPTRIDQPVGLVDIAPTLLDLVGGPDLPTDGISLAPLIDPKRRSEADALKARLTERPLALGHLMFDTERWGAVFQGWKYILHTASGEEELYDLSADPHEQTDRAAAPAAPQLQAGRAALAAATGWAVRPGWRIKLEGPRQAIRLDFAAPVASAAVIDPEAERVPRANLEWGERPAVAIEDVAIIQLSADKRSVLVRPGTRASGHRIQIGCVEACPAAMVSVGESNTALQEGLLAIESLVLSSELGTIIEVPPLSEHHGAADAGQLEALEALGYLAPD